MSTIRNALTSAGPSSSNAGSTNEQTVALEIEAEADELVVLDPELSNDELIKEIDNQMRSYSWLWKKRSWNRRIIRAVSPVLSPSGNTLKVTSGNNSTVHVGAFSTGGRDALKRIDKIIEEYDGCNEHEYPFSDFLDRLESLPCSVLSDHECYTRFTDSHETWSLVSVAAFASKKVYDIEIELRQQDTPVSVKKPRRHIKAFTVFPISLHGKNILIVSIRGTAGNMDWLVNLNGDSRPCPELMDGQNKWHAGFLLVALAMKREVVAFIDDECKNKQYDSVLYTGHSAGAAIAQIFFAMTKTKGSTLQTSTKDIPEIHCVGFAAPPVAEQCIPHESAADEKPGLFINVVNEGDMVPLAQQDYILSLLEVFLLPYDEFERRRNRWPVPAPKFHGSGKCVVLKDKDANSLDSSRFAAYVVDRAVLDTKIFGDPFMHFMDEYLKRTKFVAKEADFDWDGVAQEFE